LTNLQILRLLQNSLTFSSEALREQFTWELLGFPASLALILLAEGIKSSKIMYTWLLLITYGEALLDAMIVCSANAK